MNLCIEYVNLNDLKPYKRNPRKHITAALALSDWPRPSDMTAWMPLSFVLLSSMPTPTHHCIPFLRMVWIAKLGPASQKSLRSHTPTSVARITSIEKE